MNRSDLLLVSLGGGGNRLGDTIMSVDQRFHGFFINTSITDLESLSNYNPKIKNAMCISQQNGVGRNKDIGKTYAEQYSMSIIEKLMKYEQDVFYLISSLGGGSGSSILSVLLDSLEKLKEEGVFNKIINVMGIIPDSNSPSIILDNALETWTEIFKHRKIINSMIFIDNGTNLTASNAEDKELLINENFANLFDSIFDIPDYNGVKFDNGNLGNILKDKGCLYIYDLPSGKINIESAMLKATQHSVLAPMEKNKKNLIELEDGVLASKCGYLGISISDENYNADEVSKDYYVKKEAYVGANEDKNLVLISGCVPPNYTMELLKMELEEREKNIEDEDDSVDYFKDFSKNRKSTAKENLIRTTTAEKRDSSSSNKMLKKVMKKNLFKRN